MIFHKDIFQGGLALGTKLNYIILCGSLAVGAVLRVFMLLFTVNHSSGFIAHEYITPAILMIAVMVIAALLVFVSALTQKQKALKFNFMPLVGAVISILMAVAIFCEIFASSLLKYAPPTQSILHKASGVLAVLALLYMAACYFIKRDYPKVITVFPIVFWITRVITVFTEFAALATVSDMVLETVSMCLCLFVFMDYGKLMCGLEVKSKKLTRAVATLCGYVCLLSSLPRIICALALPEAFSYFANIPPFTTLAAALFAVNFALQIEE